MEILNSVSSTLSSGGASQPAVDPNMLVQEDFLRLMIAQLENQDPSKPVENGEFLAQIAQFSIVDGIGGLQESVAVLADTLQRNQVADAAALLGKDVLFDSNTATINAGGGIEGQVILGGTTTGVQVEVVDAAGITVATLELGTLGSGNQPFEWTGTGHDGNPVNPGDYSLRVSGTLGGVTQSLPVQLYGRVESVGVDPFSRELSLQLESGAVLGLSDIYEFK